MVPGIMKRAAGVGECPPGEPARLSGHRRRRIRGEVWPAIIEDGEETVDGILYRDVEDSLLEALDAFEGDCYERVEVDLELADAGRARAHAFRLKPGREGLLSDELWTLERFRELAMKQFMAETGGRGGGLT